MQWNTPAPQQPDFVAAWVKGAAQVDPGTQDSLICKCGQMRKISMSNSAKNPGRWYAACPQKKDSTCEQMFSWIEDPNNPAPAQKRARAGTTFTQPPVIGVPDELKLAITEIRGEMKDMRIMLEEVLNVLSKPVDE